jgi:hypothetical protein
MKRLHISSNVFMLQNQLRSTFKPIIDPSMNSKSCQIEQTQQQNHDELEEKLGSVEAVQQPKTNDSGESIDELEHWNSPRINSYRYYATNFSFLIMGMNDASPGVSYCLPSSSLELH